MMISYGGQPPESVLSSAAVVGAFYPGDDGEPELVAGGPAAAVEDVLLQEREEALHRGVVGAGADLTHRSSEVVTGQGPQEFP